MTAVPPALLDSLGRRLDEALPELDRLDAYFEGRQPLRFLAPEVRAAVGNRLENVLINWPRLVVGAVEERLDVEGFRLGAGEPVDRDLWRIWQANDLDEASQQVHVEAMVHGRAYAIVWAGDDPDVPRISVESARQVIVAYEPGTRRRSAALKRWTEDGHAFATLYEPRQITRWRSRARVVEGAGTAPVDGWVPRGEPIANPLGVVPVVPLVNRPRLLQPDGTSELADVLPLADAINKLATDLMVSAEYHAMPRRWATGIELEEDAQGELGDNFSPVAGRTWLAEDPATRMGQFPEADLTGYIAAIELFAQNLASLSSTPPHYLNILKGQLTSAESIRSAEASLVAKARRRMRSFGGSWEEALRLALLVRDGVARPGMEGLEVVWRDPETRTIAQAADAATKKRDIGVPFGQLAEDLGYTPVQIERMRQMRRAEALDATGTDLEGLLQ